MATRNLNDNPIRQIAAEDVLRRMGACSESIVWLEERSRRVRPDQRRASLAWAECERGDWMLWIAVRAGVDRRIVVAAACACAREALVHVPARELRPLRAIETAEAWTRGEATIEAVRLAAYAAADASDAAASASAYASAYAYASASASAYASASASASAADAAASASASASASAYAARRQSLARSAEIVRAHIPWTLVRSALIARVHVSYNGSSNDRDR